MAETQNATHLLEHSSWIHSLAQRLVADPDVAADLAQDTLVEALQRNGPDRNLPGWMAAVLRNKFRKLLRGDANRMGREHDVSRAEEIPSALDIVERASTHKDVVEAVLALDEPYCRTILMRYFEGLSHREIARRLGIAVPTVNSRITRGLEQLRRRLETRYGGSRPFLAALVPLAHTPKGAAGLPIGVKLMHVLVAAGALTMITVTLTVGLDGIDFESPAVLADGDLGVASSMQEPLAAVLLEEPQELPQTAEPTPLSVREPAVGRTALEPEPPAPKTAFDPEKGQKLTCTHSIPLRPGIEQMILNTRAGDLTFERSTSGQVEIRAEVRAKKSAQLSSSFFDHVKIEEGQKEITIEEADKKGERSVSFTIGLPQPVSLLANTGAGNVTLHYFGDKVNANSGAGNVTLEGKTLTAKQLILNTGAGNVEVDIFSIEKAILANSGAGNVKASIQGWNSTGTLDLNSGAGNVRLQVPSNVIGKFDVNSGLGVVKVPASLGLRVEGKGGVDGMKAVGEVGSGGGTYKLNSGVGNAVLEFLDPTSGEPL